MALPNGEPLYYEIHGRSDPGAACLLLITGLGGLAEFWAPHVDALGTHFRLVLHDHRGTGQSSLEVHDTSVEEMAGDAIALMDHLNIERAHIVGHSTGGAIGQVLAMDYPDRVERLMACASWPGKDPYFELLFHARKQVLQVSGAAEYVRQTAMIGRPPQWLRDHPEDILPPAPDLVKKLVASVECAVRRIDAIRAFDRRASLGEINCPVLVACARDDMVTPVHLSRELAAKIPGAQLEITDWGGHFYPVLRPEVFCGQVTDFFTD